MNFLKRQSVSCIAVYGGTERSCKWKDHVPNVLHLRV